MSEGIEGSSARNSGTTCGATPKSAPPAETKAGDWWDARQAGARLPAHVLPDDIDALIFTQTLERQP